MLYWVLVFLAVALLAGILGLGGLAASAAGFAKIIFALALALAVISFLARRL